MNKVIVKIAGIEYPIVGEETKEYLETLGALVNKEVESITKSTTGINLTMATTLAAINIGDKLLKGGEHERSSVLDESKGASDHIKMLEFKLQEKDVQIEALTLKLKDFNDIESGEDDIRLREALDISNQFQNRIFELQEEVEILKSKLEKAENK
ncbi:MAG: cell division protein ZapA [Filifactoraceae bacterium]